MRSSILAALCAIVAAACRPTDPPQLPDPMATPAAPPRVAVTTVEPPTPPPGEAELQEALARDPRDASAYEGLARRYFERSLSQKSYAILARQVIEQGLAALAREGRTSADLLATRGLIALHEGRVDRALADLEAAVAIAPAHLRAQAARGAVALRIRDFARAQTAFQAIVDAPGGRADVEAWLGLGVAEDGLDHFDEAARAFERASKVAPGDPRPHFALARLATRRASLTGTPRDEDATYAAFNRAHALAGDDPRFAELRALAGEGMDARRFTACYYPIGGFHGTEEEHRAWLEVAAEDYRIRHTKPADLERERRRLLELERKAALGGAAEDDAAKAAQ